MKKLFLILAASAVLFACGGGSKKAQTVEPSGPNVSGDPQKDAMTYMEIVKEDPEAAKEYLKEVEAEYGNDSEEFGEFASVIVVAARNEMNVEF
jgi:ABC-type glycerol-3-phosphate transport system substrate-binding protein